jgi:peptidyl-tRNA hydrolase, PTH1 family
MFLIFGLGNPGGKYQFSRHNIGSRVVGKLTSLDLMNVILAEPTTFMNESGKPVKALMKRYGLKADRLIVIHDDLDIPLGEIKIAKNRGPAGHKGVGSIIKETGTKNFIRLRIGICPKDGKPRNPEKFVLQRFNEEEEKIVKQVIEKTTEAVKFLLEEGLERTMSKFNESKIHFTSQ